MASIRKRGNSYLIIVSCGYDANRKKLTETMTWTPPPGMEPAAADQEAWIQAGLFEQNVKRGQNLDGEKTTFAEFVDVWFTEYAEKQLRPKTVHGYRQMLMGRVVPAIGHIRLAKLQPLHLIRLRNKLQQPDLKQNFRYKAKPGIRDVWKKAGLQITGRVEYHTFKALLDGRNVSKETAKTFAHMVGQNLDSLFDQVGEAGPLSNNTVRLYHHCVSAVLSVAVDWQLIKTNPCTRIRPPKIARMGIKFLEMDEAQETVKAAMKIEDRRIRAAVLVFMYTGIRKGELAGLQWPDIDMDNRTLTISRALQSIPGQGLVLSVPKTEKGLRKVSISPDLVDQLRLYKNWQNQERLKAGDCWQQQKHEKKPGPEKGADRVWQSINWLFTNPDGDPLHPATIYHKIKEFLKTIGYPEMTLHGLRHSNISLLLSQNVNLITAARRAGQASPSTTADIYAHALKKSDENAADKLNDLFHASITAGD